jgi:hypothetical protein
MIFDMSTLAFGGVVTFVLFAVISLHSTLRTNRRYGALGAKPPAIVSSSPFGMLLVFQTLDTWTLIAYGPELVHWHVCGV